MFECVRSFVDRLRRHARDEVVAGPVGTAVRDSAMTSRINDVPLIVPDEFRGILPVSPSDAPFAFEPESFRGLRATIRPGDVVYDIGASYGVMTALGASLAGPSGHVLSFEPNPAVRPLARMLIERNGFGERVTFVDALVGERSDRAVPFWVVPGYRSVASTRTESILDFEADARRIEVPMIALDESNGPPPNVIKIDVEGSEYAVLSGARRALTEHRPDLVIETHGDEITGIAGDLTAVCMLLSDLGYALWDLTANEPVIGQLLASTRLSSLRLAA